MANEPTKSEAREPRGEPGPPAETEWSWLGARTFWVVVAVALTAAAVTVWRVFGHLADPDAVVPVVSLSGPGQVTPNEDARYAVLVRNRSGAPLPNADVRVGFYKTAFVELGRAVTGTGGDSRVVVHFPADFKEGRALVAIASAGVAQGIDAMEVSPKAPGNPLVFLSTDKPLYQPGQTIHVRALAMADERPLANKTALIEVHTSDRVKVFRAEKQTSAFGVVSADFVLADQVKLGSYAIAVTVTTEAGQDGKAVTTAYRERDVMVKRYALPKLKLALEDVAPFAPDTPLRGSARATWIFGAPVTKGTIVVTLDQGGQPLRRATGEVDKNGVFAFVLPPPAAAPGRAPARGGFVLRAHADLEGGTGADASMGVHTLGGELKLEAFPESGAIVPGVDQTVYVLVTEAQNVSGVKVRVLPGGAPVPVSDRGFAAVRIHPAKDDDAVKLGAFGDDGSSGERSEPVSGDALVVHVDRDVYGAKDTAHVTVLGGEAGDHVSIRLTKGSEPLETSACLVSSADVGCTADLAIPEGASGLLWIHALSLPKPQGRVRVGKRLVLAGSGSRDLELALKPDQALWHPRQVGAIDVTVTGAGGAKVKAQLGASVVDEAVFALSDVRPDLERAFFTVTKDVRDAQGSGSYGSAEPSRVKERSLPPSTTASDAYAATTPSEVRGALLAALTTMHDAGGFKDTSLDAVRERARKAVTRQHKRLLVFCTLALALLGLAGLGAFALYGASRFKRPLLLASPTLPPQDIAALRVETRGLFLDVLVAFCAPPLVSLLCLFAASWFSTHSVYENVWFGGWLVLAACASLLLLRGILRLRRVASVRPATTFRRALSVLPLAILAGHVAILLAVADEGRRFETVFAFREEAFLVPVALVAAAQLTVGLFSVMRQTQLRETTRRRRWWLLLSRATLVGLPLTLLFTVVLAVDLARRYQGAGWVDYLYAYDRDEDADGYAESNADNKEGGTGVRAKGEEGSMGNPNTVASSGHRYGAPGSAQDAPPVHVRDYFPETLLWAPDVVTDDQGHARIEVPFADSITTWRFGLSAVSQAGQLGSATLPLVVKQDFFVDAELPAVLTQGDEIAVPVTVFSYAEGEQDVTLSLEGDGVSTASPTLSLHLAKGDARGTRFVLRADKAGERVVHLRATSPTHADAMDRTVTVSPNGQALTRAISGRANATPSTVEFPADAIDGADDLSIKVYGGPLSQVVEGLDGVFRMPNGCFEQTSSVTYPSVLVLEFLRKAKATNPEVEKKANDAIGQGYQRVVSFEVPGGGFALFQGGKADAALTAYGLLELSEMAHVADVDPGVLNRARDWLMRWQTKTGGWIVVPYGGEIEKEIARGAKDDPYLTAFVAWALAASSPDRSKDTRLDAILSAVASAPSPGEDAYDLTLRALALSAGGRSDAARLLLGRLAKTAIRDDHGVHFTSRARGVLSSYGASLEEEVTGLAAHALAVEGLDPEIRAGALDWLVERRGGYGTWSTTQATIAAIRALLDEAHPVSSAPQDIRIVVDGEAQEAFALEPRARDVHRLVGLRQYAKTGKHTIEVHASGDGDVSYQVVATHYLPWQRAAGAALALDVSYEPSSVQAGSTLTCHARVSWKGKEPGRMPLVEIGVPPAFEVEAGDLDALMKNGAESQVQRYTVERGKVTLYFVALPQDQPATVDVRMRALWPASVSTPASRAYLYYEPEVRAETSPARVRSL